MTKSILWRILGVIILATITFIVTGNWIQTTIITFVHHGSFIIIYYLHERLWFYINKKKPNFIGKKRRIARVFLYEIVFGNLVLGSITWLVTGSWTAVSLVTPIYIGNKLWIFDAYEKIWSKVKWGVKPLETKL